MRDERSRPGFCAIRRSSRRDDEQMTILNFTAARCSYQLTTADVQSRRRDAGWRIRRRAARGAAVVDERSVTRVGRVPSALATFTGATARAGVGERG